MFDFEFNNQMIDHLYETMREMVSGLSVSEFATEIHWQSDLQQKDRQIGREMWKDTGRKDKEHREVDFV